MPDVFALTGVPAEVLWAVAALLSMRIILTLVKDVPEAVRRLKGWRNGNGGSDSSRQTKLLEEIARNTQGLAELPGRIERIERWTDPAPYPTAREAQEHKHQQVRDLIRAQGRA
jgi:hypothetical protein